MAYNDPTTWVDGSVGGTPMTAAALNLRDNNVRDHQTRLAALEARTLLTRAAAAPVTVTYASSVTLDATLGSTFRITATGNITLADITGGVDGQVVTLEILASGGDRVVTITGGGAVTVASGTWWSGSFRYNAAASAWLII
jgi:hypothetical protein